MYFNLTKIKRRIEELARLRYHEVRHLEGVFARGEQNYQIEHSTLSNQNFQSNPS